MADLSGIAKLVRIATPGCPDPLIDDAIIDAAIDFCRRTRAVTESLSLSTVVGQAAYPLATSAGTRASRVQRVERGTIPLSESSKPVFDANHHLRAAGVASHYYLDDDSLVLGPIPDAVDTLVLSVVVEPVIGATTVPDVLYNDWRRVIASGAKAILLATPKVPWQSLADADIEFAAFNAGIDSAISKRDAGGGGYVPRARPPFF